VLRGKSFPSELDARFLTKVAQDQQRDKPDVGPAQVEGERVTGGSLSILFLDTLPPFDHDTKDGPEG
jgi:hypothetical protein